MSCMSATLVIVLEIDRMFTPEEQTQIAGMPDDEGTGTGDSSDER